jgi:predicted HTH domain antitoxin
MLMQLTIDLPDNLPLSESDLRAELAIALFQQDHISLGKASKVAGIHIMDFQKLLANRGICIHYDTEEFQQDVQHLRDKGWL